MYSTVACIHPMFHLYPNPRPPQSTGLDTMGQAVDSSAAVVALGNRENSSELKRRTRFMASGFFVPPPAAFGPAVIEIQHGSDGIYAQPVDAVAIEPE